MKRFEIRKIDNNWYRFNYMNYTGEAKIFEEGSSYGIAGGPISKLMIRENGSNRILFNYDRGFDMNELPMDALMNLLSQLGGVA